jgi:proteasome-associated ATPase
LLYGPPGCGKTLIGKATAYNLTQAYRERTGRDVREYFMLINGPQLLNMWLGETERFIREIFAAARERAKEGYLVFIFIDEADALLRVRSSGRFLNIANTVVPQFAAEMDGLVSLENVVVMLTSNRPDYIDPAILRPERIDRKVKVGRPNRDASRDIFAIYLNESVPLDPATVREHNSPQAARTALVEQAADYLFRKDRETAFLEVSLKSGRRETLYWCDLVSGALIMSAVERAKDMAIRRCIEKGTDAEGVSLEDLKEAIRQEYKESEIFPKTDYLEDWLKLLDYDPEEVVEVRPVREGRERRAGEMVV